MQFLSLAFIALWVLVTGYVFYMSRKQNELEREMSILKEVIGVSETES